MAIGLRERFEQKYEVGTDGCWLWTASRDTNGYAKLAIGDGVWDRAHRVAYRLYVGEIPVGLELDHLCRVRHCVNPEHLEAVEPSENKRRGLGMPARNKRKTHCIRGHEFTTENTLVRSNGGRTCRTCKRATQARYLAQRSPEQRDRDRAYNTAWARAHRES